LVCNLNESGGFPFIFTNIQIFCPTENIPGYNLFHYIQIALFLLFLCHIFVLFKKSQDRKYMKDKENQNFFCKKGIMRRPSVISSFPFVSIQQSNNYTHTCWLKQTPNWFDFPPLQFTGNIIWTCIAKNRFMLSIAHRVVKGEVSRRDNRWKGRESYVTL
jgi:hypothetical protein